MISQNRTCACVDCAVVCNPANCKSALQNLLCRTAAHCSRMYLAWSGTWITPCSRTASGTATAALKARPFHASSLPNALLVPHHGCEDVCAGILPLHTAVRIAIRHMMHGACAVPSTAGEQHKWFSGALHSSVNPALPSCKCSSVSYGLEDQLLLPAECTFDRTSHSIVPGPLRTNVSA